MNGERESFDKIPSPFIHHWNSELNVGVLERNGKYIGVCALAAKEVTDAENFVRKIGLDFKKDIQWHSASSLIEHLARSTPLLKVQLITTPNIPFELKPDMPENLEGRLRWAERNHNFHKEKADSLKRQVEGYEQSPGNWNIAPEETSKQLDAEERNANRFFLMMTMVTEIGAMVMMGMTLMVAVAVVLGMVAALVTVIAAAIITAIAVAIVIAMGIVIAFGVDLIVLRSQLSS